MSGTNEFPYLAADQLAESVYDNSDRATISAPDRWEAGHLRGTALAYEVEVSGIRAAECARKPPQPPPEHVHADLARFGASLSEEGEIIRKDGERCNVFVKVKGGRLQVRMDCGGILYSAGVAAPKGGDIGPTARFCKAYWFWKEVE